MFIEIFGPFPIGYFCFLFDIELLELSVCSGDEFLVGIFVLKNFFFPILKVVFLSFRVSFAAKMLLKLMTSLWPIFILFVVTLRCGSKKNLL